MLNIKPSVRYLIGCCALLVASVVWANPDTPTAMELIQLPPFCWGQYNNSLKGPEYNIQGCGVGMNHYCPGLLYLKRSEAPGLARSKQIQLLKHAKGGTEYTLHWMEKSPGCPIRSHVESTLIKVNARLVGVK